MKRKKRQTQASPKLMEWKKNKQFSVFFSLRVGFGRKELFWPPFPPTPTSQRCTLVFSFKSIDQNLKMNIFGASSIHILINLVFRFEFEISIYKTICLTVLLRRHDWNIILKNLSISSANAHCTVWIARISKMNERKKKRKNFEKQIKNDSIVVFFPFHRFHYLQARLEKNLNPLYGSQNMDFYRFFEQEYSYAGAELSALRTLCTNQINQEKNCLFLCDKNMQFEFEPKNRWKNRKKNMKISPILFGYLSSCALIWLWLWILIRSSSSILNNATLNILCMSSSKIQQNSNSKVNESREKSYSFGYIEHWTTNEKKKNKQ